ncbi:hypothetical protein PtB15_13B374 [Puccinia triticina]|nr:hypothetical protein PtB15_13B374 [Puccinia triticina]
MECPAAWLMSIRLGVAKRLHHLIDPKSRLKLLIWKQRLEISGQNWRASETALQSRTFPTPVLHSLSSIERDLSTKFELPNTKYWHVSRHFTQLQGVYGKAFSDISKAASVEAGPRSDLNSVQLTLESSIDPIAEEYKSFILSLEAQLDTIGATPTKRTAKTEAVPTGKNVISLAGSQLYPSANRKELSDRKAERISQTASSEAAIKDVRMSNGFRLHDGESQAPGGKGEKERPRDLAKVSEQSEPGRGKTLADANETQLKSLSENQGDGRLLTSFQELQEQQFDLKKLGNPDEPLHRDPSPTPLFSNTSSRSTRSST